MCAFRIGSDAAKDFENSRLRSESSKIFEPIKTNKLKTFATALKTSKTKIQSNAVQLRATCDMFNRLLIIGKSRNVDLKEFLSYSLTPVPLSLGTSDGAIRKTNKSKLIHELEKDTECVPNIPVGSELMVDGMAFIQQMQKFPSTFGQLAVEILNNLIGFARNCGCSRVDFVCDRYPSQSIKHCEREHRAVCGTQVFKITKPEQKTPKQFKKFLAEGSNKEGLVQFLFDIWVKMDPMLLGEISVVIAHGEECHSFYVENNCVVTKKLPELFSDHEEAATRLLLHANHAARNHRRIIFISPDTDVFILSVAMSHDFYNCELLFLTGSGGSRRIINISQLSTKYNKNQCNTILGLHIFTGCDSVSTFKGKGKVKPLSLMLK